ncbi:hypothetical protein NBRC116594_23470 [Shimia sp. NS0008-38b]|uniref:DMT family transporter n=1 Tax=Shimia sp. NS0008-38b TaxID=3127653 RepID=UPI0031056246
MTQLSTFHSGIALRLFSAFLMTAMSAVVHAAADSASLAQLVFFRSAVALLPIVLYMLWQSDFPRALTTKHPGLHVTRSLFGVFSMAMSFLSLTYLSVSNAQALAYLTPVLVLPLAAILLGERLTRITFVAIGLGFGGAMLLMWDALSVPTELGYIGVAAGLAYAGTMAFVRVHTKTMTKTESATTIAFYFAVVAAFVGLVCLPFNWQPLDLATLSWLILAGLIGGVGHIVSNEAVARAPVSTLAPFDYTGLIWALGFDVILFAVWPGALGLWGICAITSAALIVAFSGAPRRPPKKEKSRLKS